MNIGELNRRIKILEFVEEKDEYGAIDGRWKEIATRWARIEQNGGSEQSDNNQVIARVSIKIIIRYYARLNEKHRIKYKDKLYEINSVIDVDTGHYKMIIDCSEIKDGV